MEQNHNITYHKKTAGKLLSTNVPRLWQETTIAEARHLLTRQSRQYDSINYFYVINHHQKLEGVLSIKDILDLPGDTIIRRVMQKDLVTARVHTSQEHLALLALRHNLKAIPIIDSEDTLLGVVTSDRILQIMSEELTEDLLHLAGISKHRLAATDVIHSSFHTLIKARLPWLLVGLGGGILAAQVVGFFEELLSEQAMLILFLPIMVYMSDAVGGQTQTIFIRAIASVDQLNIKRYLIRESLSGILLAMILGVILFILVLLWQKTLLLSIILGISLFFTIIVAVSVALIVPLILLRFHKDPAVGSGPFATILRDVLSILIYFGTAHILLNSIFNV